MISRIIFPAFWISILLLFYFLTHDQLVNALFSGRHLIFLSILGLLFSALVYLLKKKKFGWILSGSGVWLMVLMVMLSIQFAMVLNLDILGETKFSRWFGLNLMVWIFVPLFFYSSLKLGTLIYKEKQSFTHLGIGIIIHTFLLWILAKMEILNSYSVGIIFLIPLILKPSETYMQFKALIFKRFSNIETINSLGWASIFVFLITFCANFVEAIRPFPKGYDALTLYFNLISAIHQKNEMIEGIGAFYGLLYPGSGLFLSNLSFLSFAFFPFIILLSGLVFFQICRKYFDINWSLAGLAMLMTVPLINSVAGLQQKIDGSVLFFSLLCLQLFLNHYGQWKKNEYLLMGIFLGFMFGIKFSSLIFILPLLAIIWSVDWNKYSLIPLIFGSLFLILEFEIDSFSGMRVYHSQIERNGYIFLALSLLGFVGIIILEKGSFLGFFRKNVPLLLGFLLSIMPLGINNYLETRKFDRQSLLFGNKKTISIDLDKARNVINNEISQ